MRLQKVIKNAGKYLRDSDYRFYAKARLGMYDNMPDEEYLKRMFRAKMGYELNLEDPKTFNEKLQWLKLHNRKPIYTTMVDKYEAKEYIADLVGEEYVVPSYGVWNRFEEIDFDLLPEQFVLKTTHDSGSVVICRDKSSFDCAAAGRILNKSLKRNFYYFGREWPYKDVKPRILAEQFLHSIDDTPIVEYKWYCFDGVPKFAERIYNDASTGIRTIDGYDADWNLVEFEEIPRPNSGSAYPKPAFFDSMISMARTLSEGIPTIRVDFLSCDEKLYVGELTFFESSGFIKMRPEEWDRTLGSWINIQNISRGV